MKLYNCPDCTHTEDTCENCARYQMYHITNNVGEYNIWWPYQPTRTFPNIPEPCQNCSNHPSNGGSGICHCILGTQNIY